MDSKQVFLKKFSLRFFWLNLSLENIPIIILHLISFIVAGFFVSPWLTVVMLISDFANSWHMVKIYQEIKESNNADLPY